MTDNIVFFAKVKSTAIIPSKNKEDAGYDFYSNFVDDEILIPKGKPTLVPTGVASAMSPKYYLNLKHERSSTGKYGISVLSGVVDSGYRGEIFVNICPLYKDVIISKIYNFDESKGKPVEFNTVIYYPYNLAIAQGTIEFVPEVEIREMTYDDLKAISSVRGVDCLGSTGK